MLSWTRKIDAAAGFCSYAARTALGTALIVDRQDGHVELDMWRPDQTSIGKGLFPNVERAKARAETILDPRATAWELLDDPELSEEVA